MYTMTCVGYDEEFIRFLVRNVHMWSPRPPKRKGAAPRIAQKESRTGTGSKRKPIEVESDGEQAEGGADKAQASLKDEEEDIKVPSSSVQEPERRSTRERVKRVRTS